MGSLTDDHVWAGFAAAAMQGVLARDYAHNESAENLVAHNAAVYADKLLAEYRKRFGNESDDGNEG